MDKKNPKEADADPNAKIKQQKGIKTQIAMTN